LIGINHQETCCCDRGEWRGSVRETDGYRGAVHPWRQGLSRPELSRPLQGWDSGRVRRVTQAIRRERRRRACDRPFHGRPPDVPQSPQGPQRDRINAVLAAAGFNFSLLLRWFRRLLRGLLLILACAGAQSCSDILHRRSNRLASHRLRRAGMITAAHLPLWEIGSREKFTGHTRKFRRSCAASIRQSRPC
jgi:hypothetical protein